MVNEMLKMRELEKSLKKLNKQLLERESLLIKNGIIALPSYNNTENIMMIKSRNLYLSNEIAELDDKYSTLLNRKRIMLNDIANYKRKQIKQYLHNLAIPKLELTLKNSEN